MDRYYVGDWARDRNGTISILEGYGTISDHLPVMLKIRKRTRNEDDDRQFRLNTSFLEDSDLVTQMQEVWISEPKPIKGELGWLAWLACTLKRVKGFCQKVGVQKAKERPERTK
jgi:hypothetical protein